MNVGQGVVHLMSRVEHVRRYYKIVACFGEALSDCIQFNVESFICYL